MKFELPPENINPEEEEDNRERTGEIVPEEQEKIVEGIESQLVKAETTASEVQELLAKKEISDAEKEAARGKLVHISNIVVTAIGAGTGMAIMWGGATFSMMEKLGLDGKTVADIADFINTPEAPAIALAAAAVGLVGALRMASSSVDLDVARNRVEGLKGESL